MPAALPADWAGLRILAAQGVTLEELSQTTGIALNTLKARSAREGWHSKPKKATEERQSNQIALAVRSKQMQPAATSALDSWAELSKGQKRITTHGLGLYAARASRVASRLPKEQLLAQAPSVKAVADLAAKVWPAEQAVSMRISMFAPGQSIDVEAEFVADESDCGTAVEPASTQGSQE